MTQPKEIVVIWEFFKIEEFTHVARKRFILVSQSKIKPNSAHIAKNRQIMQKICNFR